MLLLVDADSLAYAAAVVHEQTSAQQAIWESNTSVERLLRDTGATAYKLYLTGKTNFRYSVYPEYKANRLNMPRPQYLQLVMNNLVKEWNAVVSEGCEADDLCGIAQNHENRFLDGMSMIASIDKDLDQISGWHYNWGIKRKGEWIKPPRQYIISPNQALYFFYYQLLIGDNADNIKGVPGIGPVKAKEILKGCNSAWDYYQAILPHFESEEHLLQDARCVYIWQEESDRETLWLPPVDPSEEAQFHCGSVKAGD